MIETKTLSKVVEKDLAELKAKIAQFKNNEIDEERFKAFRLARGVYGQRQQGVQMFRLKLPFGKLTPDQLETIANLSEKYTNGNIHLTTRQNIQLHHVRLEDTPEMWEALERVGVTTKEACGNTVRNVTASPNAGIDPNEPFDVAPYAQGVFEYFLRNPICQDMGRKIKMAFSSSEEDSAFIFIHDFGFIPRIKDGQRGFKVIVGGGLGAQAFMGLVAYEFLPEDQVIPLIEAGLRVFDRYGERERRHKARLKYLVEPKKGLGLDGFMKLVEEERKAIANKSYPIDHELVKQEIPVIDHPGLENYVEDDAYKTWRNTNVEEQKQKGYYTVKVRIPLGNIHAEKARKLADVIRRWASPDFRVTLNQGVILKFVKPEHLSAIYEDLKALDLVNPGFDTLADVTACPGTDTCNLGVTNSTSLALVLEDMIRDEFPHLVDESNIKIKISGCMNSCGQHMVANIGFHGSSIKYDGKVAPAQQVVIGGGVEPGGAGYIAEKVIKIPTKRIPETVRTLLLDYEANAEETEYFNEYFRRQGKIYFYDLLKHLGDPSTLTAEGFQDWGYTDDFVPEIGVGECAGVMLDLVGTIINDAKDRLQSGKETLEIGRWADTIYYAYNAFVIGAKASLLDNDVQCNTHKGIIDDFQKHIVDEGLINLPTSFEEIVLQINKHEPSEGFATVYLKQAEEFLKGIELLRASSSAVDKLVINEFYKA
ncbi:MAG: HEPN domain-containing protein [Cyclobacteriaceae bacterium]|nr:HEPN domain-containing protein [Cyclobacteriaceae bacterium SS2]